MSQINHVDKGSQFENRIVYRKQDCVDTRGLLQLYSPHHNMQSSTVPVASTLLLHRLAHVHSPGEKSLCTSPYTYHNIIQLRPDHCAKYCKFQGLTLSSGQQPSSVDPAPNIRLQIENIQRKVSGPIQKLSKTPILPCQTYFTTPKALISTHFNQIQ